MSRELPITQLRFFIFFKSSSTMFSSGARASDMAQLIMAFAAKLDDLILGSHLESGLKLTRANCLLLSTCVLYTHTYTPKQIHVKKKNYIVKKFSKAQQPGSEAGDLAS